MANPHCTQANSNNRKRSPEALDRVFEGHGLCGPGDDWITRTNPAAPSGSFHPTRRAHVAVASALLGSEWFRSTLSTGSLQR